MKTDINNNKVLEITENLEKKILKEKGKNFLKKYRLFKEKVACDIERMRKVAEELTKTELKEYMELGMKTIKEKVQSKKLS